MADGTKCPPFTIAFIFMVGCMNRAIPFFAKNMMAERDAQDCRRRQRIFGRNRDIKTVKMAQGIINPAQREFSKRHRFFRNILPTGDGGTAAINNFGL